MSIVKKHSSKRHITGNLKIKNMENINVSEIMQQVESGKLSFEDLKKMDLTPEQYSELGRAFLRHAAELKEFDKELTNDKN